MCATCGCDGATHDHAHDHGLNRLSPRAAGKVIRLERDVLSRNARLAERNRRWLAERGLVAVNLMSSPGAGKTTLLERTIRELSGRLPIQVIEGDQATERDAERIRAAGAAAVQINTGTGCHLDAEMVKTGLDQLSPSPGSAVLIENVGNLVCPALFDLGERQRVVIASVTEGDDKPLKYPHMFRAATLVVLNKIDLVEHVPFDVDRFAENVRTLAPATPIMSLSAWRGEGLGAWYDWLLGLAAGAVRGQTASSSEVRP